MAHTPMSMGQQALASLTGNVETAMLIIHDYREVGREMTPNPVSGSGSGLLSGAASAASAAGDIASTAASVAGGAASGQTDVVAGAASVLQNGSTAAYPGSSKRYLYVQFNPSKLTLNAIAPPQQGADLTSNQDRSMAVEYGKLRLSVSLFFDAMQTYDAFMWEKFTAGLTVQGAANVVQAIRGKKPTVQPYVEALIAALRNRDTRTVSFRWNQFKFTGYLNNLGARYTMFSTSGRPIRAEVQLYLQHKMDAALLQSWYDCYEKAFSGVSSNLVRVEQNWNNLLNLNL